MKKLSLIAIALISIVCISCGGKGSVSPQDFNNSAMEIFGEANNALSEFDAKITEGVTSSDLASIAVAAESALEKVDAQIEKLKAISTKNGEKYKESVLKSLDSVKAIIETGKKYAELAEEYTREEFDNLEAEYNSKRTQLSQELMNIATAQAEFVSAIK